MVSLYDAPSAVKGIFSLHVVTACLAFLLFLAALSFALTRLKNHRGWRQHRELTSGAPLKSTLVTHLFLSPALFCLAVAYAAESAVVALQTHRDAPVSVTAAYSYYWSIDNLATYSERISALSFLYFIAKVFMSVLLTAAVWLHSTNLEKNGTGVASPGWRSRIWNTIILLVMLGLGLATWGRGMAIRDQDIGPWAYPTTVDGDQATRIIYIVYRCWVIFVSTSVSLEVLKRYKNLNANGLPGNSERPHLARFAYIVVPIIWLRNVFIVVNIVLLYEPVWSWSERNRQAIAFLFIIFGQLANLTILALVTYGAWWMGKTAGTYTGKHRESTYSDA